MLLSVTLLIPRSVVGRPQPISLLSSPPGTGQLWSKSCRPEVGWCWAWTLLTQAAGSSPSNLKCRSIYVMFMSIFWHLCRKARGISTFPFSDQRVKSFACLSFTAGCGVNQLLFRMLELLKEKHDRSLRLYFPACHNYPHCFGVFGP